MHTSNRTVGRRDFIIACAILIPVICLGLFGAVLGIIDRLRPDEVHTYVPEGTPEAEWRYQELPMYECAWCGRKGEKARLNRHHVLPQSAAPELANTPTNLVVLCRDCHQSVAHHNNFKKFEKNLMEILNLSEVVVSKEYLESHK